MSLGTDDHRIAKMAQQVKDVLPHVPLNVITKDLGKPATSSCKIFMFPALSGFHFITNLLQTLMEFNLPYANNYSENQLC